MSLHDLLTWIVGIGALIYFIVAMIKPEWFLYVPPKEREAHTEQMYLLFGSPVFQESEPLKQAQEHSLKS
jgi:hypothetical protein